VIEMMDDYYLTKEDYDTLLELGMGVNDMKVLTTGIPTAVKSDFTRTYVACPWRFRVLIARRYNKMDHPVPFVNVVKDAKSVKLSAGPKPDTEDVLEDDDGDLEEEEEEVKENADDVGTDKMIKQKGKEKAGKGKAASTSKRGGKAGKK
jgi:replication factor C subunit 1